MLTEQERIKTLHAKMDARKKAKEWRKTYAVGASGAVLAVSLFAVIIGGGAHRGGVTGIYSGSAMLYENAGGYVMAALVAFSSGVVITVLCIRRQKKKTGKGGTPKPDDEAGPLHG